MEIEDYNERLNELSLRLLGFYNEDGQSMRAEEKSPEFAQALAALLTKTFDGIVDVNEDASFKLAIENGVFLMRDKESNLYAYFHKENLARVTDVEFNRDGLTLLPLEYKNWFRPGEELIINEPGSRTNQFFYDYLRTTGKTGHQIELSADFFPKDSKGQSVISGELIAVGKNFIWMKDRFEQNIFISDHMFLRIDPTANEVKVERKVEVEDPFIPALGVIIRFDKGKGLGHVRRYGDNATLGLREAELIDPEVKKSPINKKVVFSSQEDPSYKNTVATYVHASGQASKMLQLADYLFERKMIKECREVLQHILNSDPDNEDALLKMDEINSSPNVKKKDKDAVNYEKAVELLQKKERIDEAIGLLEEVQRNGKKIKDTITRLAIAHYLRYESETDEDSKEVMRKRLFEYVKENHSKLGTAASRNMRLKYYGLLGYDEAYLDTIDSILQEPNCVNSRRALMSYYKALFYHNHKDEEKAQSFAEESLYLRPFNNNAEKFVIEGLDSPSTPQSSDLTACLLYDKNYKRDDDVSDYLQIVEQHAKTDPKYSDYLLRAARQISENDDMRSISYLTEYIALQANEYAMGGKSYSAIYFWSELFGRILPDFGHFSRRCFADFLAHLLNVDIKSDISIETYKPWENRKSWKDIMASCKFIIREKWDIICYVIGNNKTLQNEICGLILIEERLKKSFAEYSGILIGDLSDKRIVEIFDNKKYLYLNSERLAIQEINSILRGSKNLTSLCEALLQISHKAPPFNMIEQGGMESLFLLFEDCLPLLDQYIKATDAKLRYSLYEDLVDSLNVLYKGIWEAPTPFCVMGIWHIISFIQVRLRIVLPMPELKLTLTQDKVIKDNYGYFEVKGEVAVGAFQLDAQNVKLSIQSNVGLFYKPHPTFIMGLIKSGEKAPFSFRVKLTNEYKNTSFTFAIKCDYVVNGELNTTLFNQLLIHFDDRREDQQFVPIEHNPYDPTTGLNPGDPTFVGRAEDIKELVDKVLNPSRSASQVIVYGQRRCGKTTLVKALINELEKNYSDKVWCIYSTLSIDSKTEKLYDDRSFYMSLLEEISADLNLKDDPKPVMNIPDESAMRSTDFPTRLFCETIRALKMSMASTPGWEQKRLVMVIDEFTVLYGSIKSGMASTEILRNWKAIQESETTNFVTIFVGHDVTTAFWKEPYAQNAASIIDRYPLSYLEKDDAIELIDRPTRINGESRFEDAAKDKILYYTGCSPYYIQTFMSRMVDYINKKRFVKTTVTDVEKVARDFIMRNYNEFSTISDFNNLINSGLDDMYNDIKDEDIETVLRVIARNSDVSGWCKKIDITYKRTRLKKANRDIILKDLEARNVIVTKKDQNNKDLIRIIIGIFKEWLIQN